jgi:hypothetical protein
MALAAAACAFFDMPWPGGPQVGDVVEMRATLTWMDLDGDGVHETPVVESAPGTWAEYRDGRLSIWGRPNAPASVTIGESHQETWADPNPPLPAEPLAAVHVVPGIRSMAEMRALAGVR